MENKNYITKKIIITGGLQLLSPVIIGNGMDEITDNDVLTGWDGTPFLPGTSLAGVLRHRLLKCYQDNETDIHSLFGSGGKTQSSSVLFFDAYPEDPDALVLSKRDGVELDAVHRTAIDKTKYEFQIVERGATFRFKTELIIREKDNAEQLEQVFFAMISELMKGYIHVGSKANRGLGKIKLVKPEIAEIDMTDADRVKQWLENPGSQFTVISEEEIREKAIPARLRQEEKILSAQFSIPYSLLIRSYNLDPQSSDSSQLLSKDEPVLPGTSWTGAIRHAMTHILWELGVTTSRIDTILADIFGKVSKSNESEAQASVVKINESVIRKGKILHYTRNKVDRISAGVVDSALFDEEPVYTGELELEMDVSALEDTHIGLLLLALKDIGYGIQPVGGGANIGRGILQMKKIHLNNSELNEEYYLQKAGEFLKGEVQ
ncbi:MAG: RAMP superfamily CRISPR-associated protein [Calditrichia bacterium]